MNDRRHELETNELAQYMDRLNKVIEPYSRLIAVVVGALIVAAIGWLFYSTKQSESRSDATMALLQAAGDGDPEVLADVSDAYPETIAGNWARLYQGNEYLGKGIEALYNDRENATQLLGDARNAFSNSLTGSNDSLLLSRAHLGLARVAESMGELDEAIKQYEETIVIGESEAMIEMAQDRINGLNQPTTKGFLAWFADQDFSPADPSMPPSLPRGDSLPDMPDLDLPKLDLSDSLSLPGGEESDVMEKDSDLELPDDDQEADVSETETDATPSDAAESGEDAESVAK